MGAYIERKGNIMIDKNARLCSKDVQHRIKKALDVLTRDSLDYIVKHNPIEKMCVNEAIKALSELVTARTNQFMWDK